MTSTQVRQPRQIGVQATAPPTTTPVSNPAAGGAQRTLPQSTEERLAALRAAREKRKTEVGALGGPGAPPPGPAATPNPTPVIASPPMVTSTQSAADRLANRRLQSAQQTTVAPAASVGRPMPTGNYTNPAVAATMATGATGARSGSINGQTMNTPAPLQPGAPGSGRNLPSRVTGDNPANPTLSAQTISRRPSMVVIEKEKKTDYWKDVEKTATEQGAKISGEDLNQVISRAMSLGIVGDKKQRESLSAPQSHELLATLKQQMEQKIVELNGGRQINFDSLASNNASMMDKILSLERALSHMETRKSQEEEEEKKRVQSKIGELERSLRALEAQKAQQREQSRRTMKLEIANLKEMMAKVQKEKDDETAAVTESKALSAKMNRLEAALRLMNEDRKKGTVEDKDTLLLRRKLALFEQKLQEMEAEKKMKEEADQGNSLRDKLLLMEDKLAKMEKRKSTSMSLQMQQKMEQVEKQLAMLRNERSGGHSDATNTKIAQKMVQLEKQLQSMANTIVTPNMIQDEETIALRDHIKKLEESLQQQERRMDEQRNRLEEERQRNHQKRLAEEEEFRRQAKQKEEELIKRITQMEARIKAGGGTGGATIDPELIDRLKKLESMGNATISPDMSAKFTDIEKKLMETQRKLEEERKVTAEFFATAPKEGPELEAWQKDMQIAWLMKANNDLLEKLNTTTTTIDAKIKEFSNMTFVGGGGGKPASKSGLTYAEINAKLAEIQGKLFDPNTDERESEQLNIDYEKLITELESTPEYQKEQEETKNKWKKENEAPNKEAFDKVYANLKAMPENKLNAVFKRKPELKFILRTPEQITKAHVNDFKQVSTQNLLLIEARALYHNMPPFRRDQEQQSQFIDQLRQKIEIDAAKPPATAPPPIEAKKKVVIKTKKGGGGGGGGGGSGGDFLQELLEKRKRKE